MKYKVFDLNEVEAKELSTRLYFDIATARQLKFSLVRFVFASSRDVKFIKALTSRLRDMKKRGSIDLFVFSTDFCILTTEVAYILNKFPGLANEEYPESEVSVFVKL